MVSNKPWNTEMVREFGIYKPLMWSVGIWPLEVPTTFTHIRICFAIVMQTMMITNIFIEISQFYEASVDVAVDYLSLLICATLALMKILLIRVCRINLLKNIDDAASDWILDKKREHLEIMLKFARLSRIVFFLQIVSCHFVIIAMIIGPLLSPEIIFTTDNETVTNVGQELPYGSPCIRMDNFTTFCNMLHASQSIQLVTTLIGNIGSDVFLFAIAMHLCGQFEILKENFSKVAVENKVIWKEQEQIIVNIKRHNILLNLAQRVENSLYIMLIIQLCLNAIDICLLGVQLTVSLNIGDYILAIRTIVAFYVVMLQLFLYSYIGESLSSKTQAIAHGVYFSNWYMLPTTTLKDIRFIMARAGVPFYITAGKMYNIDIDNFKNILKASLSYFSILRLMLTE